MRLTPYGACAALGVLAAMTLAGHLARRSGISPDAVWDAGLFAVASCFVTSRLLLVLTDVKAFLRYPLVILGLPSLTLGGMVLAAVAVLLYLRRKRLPALQLLDLFAAPGAALAAFLELGHLLDGSEPGMPVFKVAGHPFDHLLPVSLYGIGISLLLIVTLMAALRAALGGSWPLGRVAALGLFLGGLAAFALDMLSLPEDLASDLPLEPGQMVALAAILGGGLLWVFAAPQRRPELP